MFTPFTPTHHPKASAAGRPTTHCLYAVFDAEETALRSEQALAARGIAVRRPDWTQQTWYHSLWTADAPGSRGALHSVLHDLRAELCELERYADHSAHGRVVLVACGVDQALARGPSPCWRATAPTTSRTSGRGPSPI